MMLAGSTFAVPDAIFLLDSMEAVMKAEVVVALLLCGAYPLLAEELVLENGKVFRNVTIVAADPERMLIVHDGGGCQVAYADLAPDALSASQRKAVEEGLREHLARKERMERLRLEREQFEAAQREKGLILFEGVWMKPAERQEILASRELQDLEKERMRLELEKQQAELRREEMLAAQERQRLEAQRSSSISFYYGYPARYHRECRDPLFPRVPVHGNYDCRPRGGESFGYSLSLSGGGSYLRVGTGPVMRLPRPAPGSPGRCP